MLVDFGGGVQYIHTEIHTLNHIDIHLYVHIDIIYTFIYIIYTNIHDIIEIEHRMFKYLPSKLSRNELENMGKSPCGDLRDLGDLECARRQTRCEVAIVIPVLLVFALVTWQGKNGDLTKENSRYINPG